MTCKYRGRETCRSLVDRAAYPEAEHESGRLQPAHTLRQTTMTAQKVEYRSLGKCGLKVSVPIVSSPWALML